MQGAVFALLVAAAAWFLYYRQIRNRSTKDKLILPTLRSGAIFLLVLMLTQPVIHHRKVIGELGRLFVVIDSSRSMVLKDVETHNGRKILSAIAQGSLSDNVIDASMVRTLNDIEHLNMKLKYEVDGRKNKEVIEKLAPQLTDVVKDAQSTIKSLIPSLPDKGQNENNKLNDLNKNIQNQIGQYRNGKSDNDKVAALQTLLQSTFALESLLQNSFYTYIDRQKNPEFERAIRNFEKSSRWNRLQNTLFEGQNPLIDKLAENHEIELLSLNGNEMESLWRSRAGRLDEETSVPKFLSSIPSIELTDLSKALDIKDSSQKTAVILLSDGRHNHGNTPIQQAKILGNKGIQILTVGFGADREPQDISIRDISVPPSVYYEDSVRGTLTFNDRMTPNQHFNVRMIHEGKVLYEKELRTDGSGLRKLAFDFPVKEIATKMAEGEDNLSIKNVSLKIKAEISHLNGDRQRNNNVSDFTVQAATRKRGILLVDSRPRWEFRYLKAMFERDTKWEVNTVIPQDGRFKRGKNEGELPSSREEMLNYDLIIFGDISKNLFDEQDIVWIREFVEQRSGGIIFIDGRRGGLQTFKGTKLEDVLPVNWKSAAGTRDIKALTLTAAGKDNVALNLATKDKDNLSTWSKLPKINFMAHTEAKPGTEVLAEVGDQVKNPLLIFRRFGAGKVFYSATGDFWRWRYKKGDEYHHRFWNQVVGWIMEKPFTIQDKYVSLDTGKATYAAGDKADIRVRLRDDHGRVIMGSSGHVELVKDEFVLAKLPLIDSGGGLYTVRTQELTGGDYSIRVKVDELSEEQSKVSASFKVTEPESKELAQLTCNETLLKDIALNSNGAYFREEQIRDVQKHLETLSSGRVVETDTALWQSYWYFSLVILLFSVEWVWRKRVGMI